MNDCQLIFATSYEVMTCSAGDKTDIVKRSIDRSTVGIIASPIEQHLEAPERKQTNQPNKELPTLGGTTAKKYFAALEKSHFFSVIAIYY